MSFRKERELATQTILDQICEQSILWNQAGRNKEGMPVELPMDFSHLMEKQLIELRQQGLSVADVTRSKVLMLGGKGNNNNFVTCRNAHSAKTVEIDDVKVKDENGTKIAGPELLEYLEARLPGFNSSQSGLFQGSATRACPEKKDFEFAKKLVNQDKYLVIGGKGMQGSAMCNVLESYLHLGGKGVVVAITEILNMADTKHSERLDFDSKNTVVLTTKDLPTRLSAFMLATTKTKSEGEVLIGWGGNGTLAERQTLVNNINHPIYGRFTIDHANPWLWKNAMEHTRIQKIIDKSKTDSQY
jgi:hypothetical protein